jgi:hypothetical protein
MTDPIGHRSMTRSARGIPARGPAALEGADVHAVHKDSTNNALFFAKQRNAAEIVILLEQFGAHEQAGG